MIKQWFLLGGGLIALAILFFVSLTQGLHNIGPQVIVEAVLSPQDTVEHHLLREMRIPRAIMAILAGIALAVAGVLLQTLTRNPLASAGTFGINAGAFFVLVCAAVFFPSIKASAPLLLALIGGAGAAATTYMLAGGKRSTPVGMALAGMIVTLALAAFTSSLQLFYENETNGLFLWGSGSLLQNDWQGVAYAWPWIALGVAVGLIFHRSLDVMELSEETAQSLGQQVDRTRMLALFLAVLLAAVTVSVVGPIGFVGLVAPHLVRLLGLHRHRWLIPTSALWGAVLLLSADIVARMFRSSIGELPAGVVTAVIGAPWLIWLAVRSSRAAGNQYGPQSSMSIGRSKLGLSFPAALYTASIVIVIVFLASLSAGGIWIPLPKLISALTVGNDALIENVVWKLRFPRIVVAALAGAALAVAGALIQGAVRNPLADPSIIGITSGAGVGALLFLTLFPTASASFLPAASWLGAVISSVIVYAIAWRKGFHPAVLLLVGIGITAINSAVIHFLVIQSGLTAAPALAWLAGSTYARGWDEAAVLAGALLVFFPIAFWIGRRVDLLAFGDETSIGLGLSVQQTRLLSAFTGVALASIAVSAVGTIGFIGLLAPHAARMMVGHHSRRLIVISALLGSALLIIADGVGRVLLAPKEIPAGLVVALIGTPYLLYFMFRNRR